MLITILDGGNVIESGDSEKLSNENGLYHKLIETADFT